MKPFRNELVVFVTAFAASCAFEPGNPPDAAALDADACEHLGEGVVEHVIGAEEPDASKHTEAGVTYELSGTDPFFVTFEADTEGEYAFYVVEGAALSMSRGGETVEAEESRASEECDAVRRVDVFHLEAGDYLVEVSGVDHETLFVLAIGGSNDAHDDAGDEHDH